MRTTLGKLAAEVGGELVGPADLEITGVNTIEAAGPGEITFLSNPRYRSKVSSTGAGAILISPGVDTGGVPRIEVANPYLAMARMVAAHFPPPEVEPGVDPGAQVHPSAEVDAGARVFGLAYVGAGASVGRGTVLYPGVYVGAGARVGSDCVLYPNVSLMDGCRLGDRVILHSGVVVGGDGFGFAPDGELWFKINQTGMAEIEDDVELGANTCIDRPAFGRTLIRRGVKMDNLIQIGHSVEVGENSLIVGQSGVAGSTVIGRHVTLAAGAGITGHVHIGDGATIGPRCNIAEDVGPGEVLIGYRAQPVREGLRTYTALPRLPEYVRRIRALEKKVEELESMVRGKGGLD